jgi:hypothetical protein
MGQSPGSRRFIDVLAGCSLLAVVACQSPGSQPIVGPDGSQMAHVHCGSDQGVCFRIAGELCPGGYELTPVMSGRDGNFLVRCRSANARAVAAACATPSQAAAPIVEATRTPGPGKDTWPPSAEPSAPYPWPAGETSAAARTQPSAPAVPTGEVDVGY